MSSNPNLSRAIIAGDKEAVDKLLNYVDINQKYVDINQKYGDGNVLQWAITGSIYNQKEPVGKGNYDMMLFLLEKGADPNIPYLIYTPVYYATNENRDDMLVQLLNYDANPNTYYVRFKKDGDSEMCFCKTALVHAIENRSVLCVEALVKRGAIYNNQTVKYAGELKDTLYETRRENPQDYLEYQQANSIYTTLKENYSSSREGPANNFMRENMMTSKRINFFVGMES